MFCSMHDFITLFYTQFYTVFTDDFKHDFITLLFCLNKNLKTKQTKY